MEAEKTESGFVTDVDRFFEGWVKKDTHPLRKKGVWAEDIYHWMKTHPNEFVCSNEPYETAVGYHEVFWTGNVNGIDVKYVWFSARLGIPSLIIGTKTKQDWSVIRTKLRAAGLIRER